MDGRVTQRPLITLPDRYSLASCPRTMPAVKTLSRHRITADDYRRLRNAQEGVCGICRRGNGGKPLVIDHDHMCCANRWGTCGRCVRGLLCPGCNGWLGMLELWTPLLPSDGRPWRQAAVAYLARAGCDPTTPERRRVLAERHWVTVAAWKRPCACLLCCERWPERVELRRIRERPPQRGGQRS